MITGVCAFIRVIRYPYTVARVSNPNPNPPLTRTVPQRRQKDLRTIMHCALWSDPDLSPSLPNPQPNPRGAGVLFGSDSTKSFLEENGLDMIVRSHECVEEGFDLPFEDEMEGEETYDMVLCWQEKVSDSCRRMLN